MSLGQQLYPHLPFLRHYARALTGSQMHGDAYVRATLEAIVAAPEEFPADVDVRIALYRTFGAIWSSTHLEDDVEVAADEDTQQALARARLARMTPLPRQALLLTSMEGFSSQETGEIMGIEASEVDGLVNEAMREIDRQTRADVLIIEDEPIIAMDIEMIVRDLGHDVVAVATTHAEAVAEAQKHQPGLVLADIQLADNSSGIEAVQEILQDVKLPVIFITAFPERLLTGDRPEPAFLLTKPYQPATLRAAISQVLFFDESTVPA